MQIVALGLVFFATVSTAIAVRFGDVLANASSDFAATLLQQAGEATSSSGDNTRNSNVILSPLSVMTGLSMLSLGAKSTTAQEIRKAITRSLSLPKLARGMDSLRRISNTADRLTTADRIWPKQGTQLNKEFIQKVRYVFRTAVEAVDFDQESAARQRINEWASNATNGEIDEVVPPGFLSASTRMILTDAIYFKGEWKSEFKAKETKCTRFHACDPCASTAVDMMSQTGNFPYRYSRKDRVAVLEMPYRGDNVSMFVLLPDDCASMNALQANMNGAKIRELISDLTSQRLDVRFPRFQLNYRASLAKTLRRMGIRSAFTAGVADFSGIDGTRNLYVSDAVHEAVINVDEEGTKAAAVMMTGLQARMMIHTPEFRADRPFLFVIVDKRSNATLFAGRIADPREFGAKKCDGKRVFFRGVSPWLPPVPSPNSITFACQSPLSPRVVCGSNAWCLFSQMMPPPPPPPRGAHQLHQPLTRAHAVAPFIVRTI